jgi:hypothetical protein
MVPELFKISKIYNPIFGVFFLLIAASEVVLNIPPLAFYMPWEFSWCLAAVPALLVVGFIGNILRMKIMAFAGWVGICFFALCSLGGIGTDLEYSFGDYGYPPITESLNHRALIDVVGRLSLALILSVSLAICFRRLAVKFRQPVDLEEIFGP